MHGLGLVSQFCGSVPGYGQVLAFALDTGCAAADAFTAVQQESGWLVSAALGSVVRLRLLCWFLSALLLCCFAYQWFNYAAGHRARWCTGALLYRHHSWFIYNACTIEQQKTVLCICSDVALWDVYGLCCGFFCFQVLLLLAHTADIHVLITSPLSSYHISSYNIAISFIFSGSS